MRHRKGFITKCLQELNRSFQIRPELTLRAAEIQFQYGLFLECIRELKNRIGISCRIKVFFCKTEKTNNPANSKKAGARVMLPENLPLFHQAEFSESVVTILIEEEIKSLGFYPFAYTVLHELCHILLYSLRNSLGEEEKAVDLTVMALGFTRVVRLGRNNPAIHLGYLTDTDVEIAEKYIRKAREGFY